MVKKSFKKKNLPEHKTKMFVNFKTGEQSWKWWDAPSLAPIPRVMPPPPSAPPPPQSQRSYVGQLGYNHDIISCRASCRPVNGRFPPWEHSEENVDVGNGATFRGTNGQLPPWRVGLSSSLVPFFSNSWLLLENSGGAWAGFPPPSPEAPFRFILPSQTRCVLAKYNLARIQSAGRCC